MSKTCQLQKTISHHLLFSPAYRHDAVPRIRDRRKAKESTPIQKQVPYLTRWYGIQDLLESLQTRLTLQILDLFNLVMRRAVKVL